MDSKRQGLVDGPSWILHAVIVATAKLGPDAAEERIYSWACERLFAQCQIWAERLHLRGVWIAMDGKIQQSWRREIMEEYKSARSARERDPRVSPAYWRIATEFLVSHKLPMLWHEKAEAEDIIFVARSFMRTADPGRRYVVFSRDGDLCQMEDARGDTAVLNFWGRKEPFLENPRRNEDRLWKRILAGDRSDSIPEIPMWHKLPPSEKERLLHDPQYRTFWLQDRRSVAKHVERNQRLIDLRRIPSKIVDEIYELCRATRD